MQETVLEQDVADLKAKEVTDSEVDVLEDFQVCRE